MGNEGGSEDNVNSLPGSSAESEQELAVSRDSTPLSHSSTPDPNLRFSPITNEDEQQAPLYPLPTPSPSPLPLQLPSQPTRVESPTKRSRSYDGSDSSHTQLEGIFNAANLIVPAFRLRTEDGELVAIPPATAHNWIDRRGTPTPSKGILRRGVS